jgi:hypothetical protein
MILLQRSIKRRNCKLLIIAYRTTVICFASIFVANVTDPILIKLKILLAQNEIDTTYTTSRLNVAERITNNNKK